MKRLAEVLEAVRATPSKKEKVALLSSLFAQLDQDELVSAVRVVNAQPLPIGSTTSVGVGWALVMEAAMHASGLTSEAVLTRLRDVGDLGEALGSLWPHGSGFPLASVGAFFESLAATHERRKKLEHLVDVFKQCSGGELTYLVKAILGELRVGVQRGTLDEALAQAFGAKVVEVRAASTLVPDIGTLAVMVQQGRLKNATLTVGQVVAFMLATPNETVKEPIDPAMTVVEDKIDGVRAQVHLWPEGAAVFARGTGDVTVSFPDVVQQLRGLGRRVVLDGEIVAVAANGRPRPFQALQARLGRTNLDVTALRLTPVEFVAYDLLFDEENVMQLSWRARRARLESLGLRVNAISWLRTDEPVDTQLERLFADARQRGHEGLMLKRVDAPYEAGRRGSAWRKVKRPFATLDVVVTRAERGHGKRARVLSDYTFAVWHQERLVEVGKAYSGLTDAEIAELTVRLESLTLRHDGRYRFVKPAVVLEVAFDGIQLSRRHASGYALRFPRIVRIRTDKAPDEADRLETVKALFESQVTSGHRESSAQMGLFDE